jgi:fermentation-respiration switch protein FrsA (DUF1100 family)
MTGLLTAIQEKLVYFPDMGREMVATPAARGLAYEEEAIATSDGETLVAWWVPAREAKGTVLLLHGNAGNISHRIEYLAMFAGLGYSTLLVDYRGYGRSTGTPSEEGTYRDADAAWDWLTARGIAGHDVVLLGESLGGGVATWLAAKHPPRALVLASTFTSIPDLAETIYPFLPVHALARIRYDSLARLAHIAAPVLILHSPEDEIVPYAHAERLYAAARGRKRLVQLAGGHNDGFVYTRGAWVDALAQFLEEARR